MKPSHPRPIKLRSFYIWHRYIGVSVSLLVILLAVTGVLLNHTERFQLDSRFIKNEQLLDWYGISADVPILSYAVGERHVSQIDDRLYLDTTPLPGRYLRLHGALMLDGMIVIAVDSNIMLVSANAQVIEVIGGSLGVPAGITAIAVNNNAFTVSTANGHYASNAEFDEWHALPATSIDWVRKTTLPDQQRITLQRLYRGSILPLERVILDLHSGRLFGGWGVYLMDLAALLLLFLALSGCWMWLRQKRRRSRNTRAYTQ